MPSPRKILPLLAGTAVCAAVVVPVAGAAPMPQITTKYTYKVELEGVQKTTWTYNHADQGRCDSAQSGQGKQTIRFAAKPAIVHMYDGISPTFFTGDPKKHNVGTLTMRLHGTVTRAAHIDHGPPPPLEEGCADGVGGPAPVPDCGTKRLKKTIVTPQYEFNSDKVVIEQENAPSDSFQDCPNLGDGFPYLQRYDDANNKIGQNLPTADLFKHGQNIIIARGTKTEHGEVQSKTTIRWSLSFKKLKEEDLTKKS